MKKGEKKRSSRFKQLTLSEHLLEDRSSSRSGDNSRAVVKRLKYERKGESQFTLSHRPSKQEHLEIRVLDESARKSQKHTVPTLMFLFSNIMSALELPRETRELAFEILGKAGRGGFIRGKKAASIAAAAIYAACRINGNPRQLSHIAPLAKVSSKSIGRSYRIVASIIDQDIPQYDPLKVVERVCELLGAPKEIEEISKQTLQSARAIDLASGKDPWGIAAAAIYLACYQSGIRLGQVKIAEAAGVSEVTLRNRYKEIATILNLESHYTQLSL